MSAKVSSVFDVVVVGAGIVGLATAFRLLERHPGLRLAVLEKEHQVASQQTGHNSGVIHSGIYYAPGSLKARTCVAGSRALYRFCDEHDIRYERCGKVIVARDESELGRLQALFDQGNANGVERLEMLGPDGIREVEPYAVGIQGIHVPSTGIVDFAEVAAALVGEIQARGGEIHLDHGVEGLCREGTVTRVRTNRGDYVTHSLIACAGLHCDRVAEMSGARLLLRIIPFRGDYYVLKSNRTFLCKALLYPVPDPSFPFLGVHFTRRLDGSVWAGPNAVLSLARQGYGRFDFDWRDTRDIFTWPGFWKLARTHWRMGLMEMVRDHVKLAYVRTMQDYVPDVGWGDVLAGPSGVRAQALDCEGVLVDDFAVHEDAGMIHVLNAPSPAATSSLSIADMIVERAEAGFDLVPRHVW